MNQLTLGLDDKTATISDCRCYRYALGRRWADGPAVLFVMLNPSTADASRDDPTIRRCIGFARAWGFGSLLVGNLFAYRATAPDEMRAAADPIGPDNDEWLSRLIGRSGLVVAAWGAHGGHLGRDRAVRALRREWVHLGLTKGGHPRHPLYVPANQERLSW